MKLLAVETAFERCSVALWIDGTLRERVHDAPRGHAEHLLPFVTSLLEEAELPLASLDAIAFSRGPGSFTSLRIGIGVVQGLAFGADLPVVPVSSLRATALAAGLSGRLCVAMDARMDEVFTGCFEVSEGRVHALDEERVCAPDDALPDRPSAWTGVGNGFSRFPALAEADFATLVPDAWPRAAGVAALAAEWLGRRPGLAAEAAQPVYLRDRVADKPGDRSS